MLTLFEPGYSIPICYEYPLPECVRLAILDFRPDICRLSGQKEGFSICRDARTKAIFITTGGEPLLTDPESYRIEVNDAGLFIHGSDPLGTVFGIYAASRLLLGIDPMFRFTDLFPETREKMQLECMHFESPVRTVRFRGWFLNDEDLLSEFMPGGGIRTIDYPFYHQITHPRVLEMVIETALRLEMNLLIPASFVNIDHPDEEKLVAAVCERGLYISQHHVEPMGVSYFSAAQFLGKQDGNSKEVSFWTNRTKMEEIWRYYAKKWAVYGDHVLWQLGLRGKADQPVWYSDPSIPDTKEIHGQMISDAIAAQYNILCETLGHDHFHSTVTLWMEGAELYARGYLKIPQNTTVLFSDIGFDQLFGDDFYQMPRNPKQSYGIYLHTAFWGNGPHFAEGYAPEKMFFCMQEARKFHSLSFCILNVANVREFLFSIRLCAAMLNDPKATSLSDAVLDILHDYYGEAAAAVAKGLKQYYQAFADLGEEMLQSEYKRSLFDYHAYDSLPFIRYPANDGKLRLLGLAALNGELPEKDTVAQLRDSEARFAAVAAYWEQIAAQIPAESRTVFAVSIQLQTQTMWALTQWCLACIDKRFSDATEALQRLLKARQAAKQGFWANWYRGDKKMNLYALLDKTLDIRSKKLRNSSLPPH